MLHLFGNIYGVVANVLDEILKNFHTLANSENSSDNALSIYINYYNY